MNPPNTKQSPSTMLMNGYLSRTMSAAPSSMYFSPTVNKWENMINQRIGLVTPERLMNAAKHKQRYEVITGNVDLPDLWSQANAQLLNGVALDVLQHSKPGESIERLADKVVVICTLLHQYPMLDKNHAILSVNNVFMNWGIHDTIDEALSRTMSRIRGLGDPRRLHKGGFHKKTKCRGSSKKSKSRKSRSRR